MCHWSSASRQCSNCIWMINNFIAILGSQLKGYISLIENYHQWILFFHHKVDNHFCDEQGPFVTIHIQGLHWVKCFICNAVLATKCTNTWSLIIAYIIVHVILISMIFQISEITEYLFMPTYFITFFGMTVYVNISVIYPLIQNWPKQTHISPLCAHSMGYLDIRTKLSSLISGPHVL